MSATMNTNTNVATVAAATSPSKSSNAAPRRASPPASDSKPNFTNVDDLVIKTNERVRWTEELHEIFVKAALKLGPKAVPSRILAEMNCKQLTRDQVASHLQNYRSILFPNAAGASASGASTGNKKAGSASPPSGSKSGAKRKSPDTTEASPSTGGSSAANLPKGVGYVPKSKKKRTAQTTSTVAVQAPEAPKSSSPASGTGVSQQQQQQQAMPDFVASFFLNEELASFGSGAGSCALAGSCDHSMLLQAVPEGRLAFAGRPAFGDDSNTASVGSPGDIQIHEEPPRQPNGLLLSGEMPAFIVTSADSSPASSPSPTPSPSPSPDPSDFLEFGSGDGAVPKLTIDFLSLDAPSDFQASQFQSDPNSSFSAFEELFANLNNSSSLELDVGNDVDVGNWSLLLTTPSQRGAPKDSGCWCCPTTINPPIEL